MFVCKNCFADKELQGFILSQSHIGKCDFCNSENAEILDTKELFEFFNDLIENFKNDAKGERLISIIQSNWGLFSNIDLGEDILDFILEEINSSITSPNDLVRFNDDILDNVKYWFELKEKLKWERRYITDIEYLTEDLGWDGFFDSKQVITPDDVFYRGRVHYKIGQNCYSKQDMLCPPKEISTAGRANSNGIPYLYLCDNPNTVLYEVRSSYLDEISIAEIRVKKGLEKDIVISDFTITPTLYVPGEVDKIIKSTLLKQLISKDLSTPLRRYDSQLDYIPTQFICEFIKVFSNVNGIKFRSSLHNVGNNIVIFDENNMECIDVKKVRVNSVSISSEHID